MAKNREAIIAGFRRTADEIDQIFTDIAHWNQYVRQPGEAEIDPDPDRKLGRMSLGLRRALAQEDARPIPSFGGEDLKPKP